MRVDLPTLLAVLAHEIRGPVSALQGYLRLLQHDQRPASSSPLPDAMRGSLARLASLGTDASDLATWCKLVSSGDMPRTSIEVAALMDLIRQRSPLARPSGSLGAAIAAATLEVIDATFMARALAALSASVARETDQEPCTLLAEVSGPTITIHIEPATSPASTSGRSDDSAPGPMSFERGGMGLELVLASQVLAAHEAVVHTTAGGGVVVGLPRSLRS